MNDIGVISLGSTQTKGEDAVAEGRRFKFYMRNAMGGLPNYVWLESAEGEDGRRNMEAHYLKEDAAAVADAKRIEDLADLVWQYTHGKQKPPFKQTERIIVRRKLGEREL